MQNTFSNNLASYGKNYASYPFELKLMTEDKVVISSKSLLVDPSRIPRTEYFSGEQLKKNFIVGIFDQNGQLVSTDSES